MAWTWGQSEERGERERERERERLCYNILDDETSDINKVKVSHVN